MSGKASRGVSEKEWISAEEEGWNSFRPVVGDILEVDLSMSTVGTVTEGYLAMYITSVEDDASGGNYVGGKVIGTSQTGLEDAFISMLSTDNKFVHLCAGKDCNVEDEKIGFHCRKVRWHQLRRFKAPYIAPWGDLVLKEAREKHAKQREDGRGGRRRVPAKRPGGLDPLRRVRSLARRGEKKKKPKHPGVKEENEGGGEPLDLREKLRKLRERIAGGGKGDVISLLSDSENYEDGDELNSEDWEIGLKTGSGLTPQTTALALRDQEEAEDTRGGMVKKEKVRRRVRKNKKEERLKSRPSSALLAAAEQMEERKNQERRKKKSKKSKGGKEVKALVDLLKGKKRKSRGKKGPSSSGGSSSSSDEDSDQDEESDSSEMLAPLQKRSFRKPGTVLKMLVKHARSTLDQSSAVDVDQKGSLTSGIRMATYFNLMIRPYHSSGSRDMKELHYLSIAMDELRQGLLGKLGDSLASRFLAVHAAVNEGTWKSAQYLELHPLEATQSAPTPVLLEAKKHSRLINKSLNNGEGIWRRPRFQGDWRNPNWVTGDEKGKGKGGKGKDGKGRGKGRGSGGKGYGPGWQRDGQYNWWDQQRETKESKEGKDGKDAGKKEK